MADTELAVEAPASNDAFDQHAEHYDAVATSDLGRTLRARVRRVLCAAVQPGSTVLDVGCGTGLDTAWLASRGRSVTAIDPSAAMAALARERCAGLSNVEVHTTGPGTFAATVNQPSFDVIVANFGVINCVPPGELTELVKRCLRPRGCLVLVPMPAVCPFERVVGWVTRRPELARRRRSGRSNVARYEGLELTYPDHRALGRVLPDCTLESVASLGLTLPTFEYRRHVEGRRRLLASLDRVDTALAPIGGRLGWGDHLITVFVRDPA